MTDLLCRAQKLYAEAHTLKNNEDRAVYLKHLKQVGGLLAYLTPENGPAAITTFLTQARRDDLAKQINQAILRMPQNFKFNQFESDFVL